MTLAQRATRGAAIVFASSYTNMALGMVYGIFLARLITNNDLGVFTGAMFFFTLVDLRGKLGLDYAFINRQPTDEALIATHWALQIGAAGVTCVLVAIAAAMVSRLNYPPTTAPLMLALAGAMVVEAAGTTARAALEKELVFARSSLVVTGALLVSYLTALGLAAQGYTYWALVGQVVVNVVVSSVGFWWAYRRLGQRPSIRFNFDRALAGRMLRFGATLAIGSFAIVVLLQFDNFLVLTFVNAATLGDYALAYKVAQWPTGLVTHIIARASVPTYAKLQNDPARLSKAFELSLWLILMVALPLALAIFVSAPDFILLLYGPAWPMSGQLLRFLIGYSILRPLLDDTGALFTAIGQPKRITVVLVVQALTLIAVATPLTILYGAIGTAIGVGAAFVVGIGLTYYLVTRTIPIKLAALFGPPAFALFSSLGLYALVTHVINFDDWPLFWRVLTKGGSVALLFLLMLVLVERRTLRERVRYIWGLIRSPV